MRRSVFIRSFVLCILLSFFITGLSLSADTTEISLGCFEIQDVIDGDTFDADLNSDGYIDQSTERIRILGIDAFEYFSARDLRAPEVTNTPKYHRLQKQAETYALSVTEAIQRGREARSIVRIAAKSSLVCLITSGVDRGYYGRLLSYAEFNTVDIGQVLLSQSLAYVYRSNKAHNRYSSYLEVEVL